MHIINTCSTGTPLSCLRKSKQGMARWMISRSLLRGMDEGGVERVFMWMSDFLKKRNGHIYVCVYVYVVGW